jgi:hypothetical protein
MDALRGYACGLHNMLRGNLQATDSFKNYKRKRPVEDAGSLNYSYPLIYYFVHIQVFVEAVYHP